MCDDEDEEEHDTANREVEAPDGESEEDTCDQGEQEISHDEEGEEEEEEEASAAPSSEAGEVDAEGGDDNADDSDDYSVRVYEAARRAAGPRSATQLRFEAVQRQQDHERFIGARPPPQPDEQHHLLLQQQILQLFRAQEQLLRQREHLVRQQEQGRELLRVSRRRRRRRRHDDDKNNGGDDDLGSEEDDSDGDDDDGDGSSATTSSSNNNSNSNNNGNSSSRGNVDGDGTRREQEVRLIRQALGLGVQHLSPARADDANNSVGATSEVIGGSVPRGIVTIDSESIEHAVDDLEHAAGDEIKHLVVSTNLPREEWSQEVVANHPECFRRLVELLGEPGRILRSIKFETVIFDLDDGIRAADLDRLFGTTLPLHPTLRKIEFERCYISPRHFAMFTASLPSNATPATDDDGSPGATIIIPTKELVFEGGMQEGWMISADRIGSIADMVGRNARVHSLTLTTDWQGFDPDMFQLVCSGLQNNNTHLRSLTADLVCIPEGTLDQALAPASPLEALRITRGALHGWVTPSVARLLASNATLLELDFAERIGNDGDPHRLDDIAAALEASNFTLQRFSEGTAISTYREHCHHHLLQDSRIGKSLRRTCGFTASFTIGPSTKSPSRVCGRPCCTGRTAARPSSAVSCVEGTSLHCATRGSSSAWEEERVAEATL
jgi:hypothetical protein